MGGALAIHLTGKHKIPNLFALAIIDVVEGTAIEALSYMRGYLKNRPQYFDTIEKGIRWSLNSGATINRRAARISMPSQLKESLNTVIFLFFLNNSYQKRSLCKRKRRY